MKTSAVLRQDVADWLRELAEQGADPVLDDMHALANENGFPIVGPEVGRLLAQLATMVGAQRIFELGSGFGYSTLWFARAIGPGATIFHTDANPENTARAREFLRRAGVVDRVRFITGDAMQALRETDGQFDIVFCDVDKHQYPAAYEAFADRVRVGGLAVVDNLVWFGRVAAGDDAPSTQGVREYIDRMWADERFQSSLMPVRDGVGISLKLR